MRYRISTATVVVAAALIVTYGVAGATPDVGAKGNGLSICEEQYLELYEQAQQKFGSGAVGANLVDDGTPAHDAYNLPEELVCAKADVLDAMLHPAPTPTPVAVTSDPVTEYAAAPVASYSAAPATSSSSGGCPASMAGEADSPTDVNPSSGAAGCYQVIPSTAAAMGPACDDVNAASCLAAICASQGNAAWAASGSTPC